MGFDRRTLLRALGAGVGLSGAMSAEARRLRPVSETDQSSTTALSEQTDRIMDELAWFATEYPDAIDAFREAAAFVLDAISEAGETVQLTDSVVKRLDGETERPRLDRGWPYDIWWDEGERRWRYVDIDWQRPTDELTNETPLSAAAIANLRETTTAFVETFEAELDPHFYGLAQERAFPAATIDTIAEYNDRGDIAMVVAGLVRLFEHYEAVSSATYIERSLSETPIRNRLAGYLSSSVSTSTPPLFEVDYRSGPTGAVSHLAFVYDDDVGRGRRNRLYDSEPLATIDGSTSDNGGRRLQSVVSELNVSTDREDRCYVLVNEWTDPSPGYYSETLPSQPIFVQRYESERAANDAYDQLLDRPLITSAVTEVQLGQQGTEPWTGIYFPHERQPWSGLIRQSGRQLIVVGVARRPLQQRDEEIVGDDWTDPLRLAWVWAEGE